MPFLQSSHPTSPLRKFLALTFSLIAFISMPHTFSSQKIPDFDVDAVIRRIEEVGEEEFRKLLLEASQESARLKEKNSALSESEQKTDALLDEIQSGQPAKIAELEKQVKKLTERNKELKDKQNPSSQNGQTAKIAQLQNKITQLENKVRDLETENKKLKDKQNPPSQANSSSGGAGAGNRNGNPIPPPADNRSLWEKYPLQAKGGVCVFVLLMGAGVYTMWQSQGKSLEKGKTKQRGREEAY